MMTNRLEKVPIRNWDADERPREKLIQRGLESLTDAELIGIILGTGTRDLSAIDLGRMILKEFGSIGQVASIGVDDLTRIRGIGKAKAIGLVAAFELGRRKIRDDHKTLRFRTTYHAAQYIRPRLVDLEHEEFWVIFLNRSNTVLGEQRFALGGLVAAALDVRLILKQALRYPATAIILAHNHPSGGLRPSDADIALTRKIQRACDTLEISVLDHVIISKRGYYSFSDQGNL